MQDQISKCFVRFLSCVCFDKGLTPLLSNLGSKIARTRCVCHWAQLNLFFCSQHWEWSCFWQWVMEYVIAIWRLAFCISSGFFFFLKKPLFTCFCICLLAKYLTWWWWWEPISCIHLAFLKTPSGRRALFGGTTNGPDGDGFHSLKSLF